MNVSRHLSPGSSWLPILLVSLLLQSAAQAHLAVEGAGEIGNGALHPLLTPAHALILLGLALLIVQRVPLDLKRPMMVLAPVSAVALLLTTTGMLTSVYQPILIGIAMLIATLVALDLKVSPRIGQVVSAVAAIGIGLDSGLDKGPTLIALKTLLGTWISINLVVPYLAICVSHGADKTWARTGIRVIGSWIIAISLLVLAFSLRK